MSLLSRRTFISASAAIGFAGTHTSLFAKSVEADSIAGTLAAEGVFDVYQSKGRAMIIVRSAENAPFPVVFDTGTNGNAVDLKIIKALQLKPVPNHINKVVDGATGASFDAHEYAMPDISIGSLKIGSRQIAGYPYDVPDEAGIFGPNLFIGQLVYVDLGASRVCVINKASFAKPERPPIPYLGAKGNGLPALELLLPWKDGSTPDGAVIAKLDSGNNNALLLPESYMDQLQFLRPVTTVGRATSISGSRDVKGGQIHGEVKIGPVSLINPDVIFTGQTPNAGLPVIRQLRFILDPEAEQSWLLTPLAMTPEKLSEYVGQYGVRRVSLKEGQLIYQREGGPERSMTPLDGDLFELGDSQDQLLFERVNGKVAKLKLITGSAQMLSFVKTGPA